MKIGVGADNNGFKLKEAVKKYLVSEGYEVRDYGTYSEDAIDYPGVAFKLGDAIINKKEIERGILFCGTGIGMQIAANKIPGIRAAQINDPYQAQRAELSNNAQIITFGGFTTGVEVAKSLSKIYLENDFQKTHKAGSERKVNEIVNKECSYNPKFFEKIKKQKQSSK